MQLISFCLNVKVNVRMVGYRTRTNAILLMLIEVNIGLGTKPKLPALTTALNYLL